VDRARGGLADGLAAGAAHGRSTAAAKS